MLKFIVLPKREERERENKLGCSRHHYLNLRHPLIGIIHLPVPIVVMQSEKIPVEMLRIPPSYVFSSLILFREFHSLRGVWLRCQVLFVLCRRGKDSNHHISSQPHISKPGKYESDLIHAVELILPFASPK